MAADILNVIIEYVFSFPHIHKYTHIHAQHAHKKKIHTNELDLCLVGHKEYPWDYDLSTLLNNLGAPILSY